MSTERTVDERRDIADLSPAEQHAYYQYRRRMSHDDALQSARDAVAERFQQRIGR